MGFQQHKIFRTAFCLTLTIVFCAIGSTAALAAGADVALETTRVRWIYGIIAAVSLFLAFGCSVMVKRKYPWLLVLFVSVCVVNTGYFTLAISRTLEEAMLANRIAYLGSVCLPLCMLMIIMELCEVRATKAVTGVLIGLSVMVFLLAASGGYLQLYYKEVTFEVVNGAAKLCKVYGPFHQVYFIYLLAYFAAMVSVIIYSGLKKKGKFRKYAPVMCTVALLNMAIWFIEQQIDWDFEFLSISYMVSELLLLFLYNILRDYEQETRLPMSAQNLSSVYPSLTSRELDVLRLLLENKKRKEIADALFVTENTVKKHTAHIYEKLEVSDRSELLLKLGKTVM